jgi:hypothetical protein
MVRGEQLRTNATAAKREGVEYAMNHEPGDLPSSNDAALKEYEPGSALAYQEPLGAQASRGSFAWGGSTTMDVEQTTTTAPSGEQALKGRFPQWAREPVYEAI